MKKTARRLLAFAALSGALAGFGTEVLNVNFYQQFALNAGFSGMPIGADNCTVVTNSCWTTVGYSGNNFTGQQTIKDCFGNSWAVTLSGTKGNHAYHKDYSSSNIGRVGGGYFLYNSGTIAINLTNIPFTKYDIVLYLALFDNSNFQWGSFKVGDKYYIPDPENPYRSKSDGVDQNTKWGCSLDDGVGKFKLAFGQNAIVIDGLTNSTANIVMGRHSNTGKYAGIYGFQIVNRGDIIVPDGGLNFTCDSQITEGFSGTHNVCASNCVLDLTRASWTNFTGKFTTAESGKLVLAAGKEPADDRLETNVISEVIIQLEAQHVVTGYTTNVGVDANKIKFRAPDGTMLESQNSKTYTPSVCTWSNSSWSPDTSLTENSNIKLVLTGDSTQLSTITSLSSTAVSNVLITGAGKLVVDDSSSLQARGQIVLDGVGLEADAAKLTAPLVIGTAGTEEVAIKTDGDATNNMRVVNCALSKRGSGTLTLTAEGFELEDATVRLESGKLRLGANKEDGTVQDAKIKNAKFVYVDSANDGTADGELTCNSTVKSDTTVTFVVPTNTTGAAITGKAFVGQNLSGAGMVVKQGGGILELGLHKDRAPYTGATVIEEGALNLKPLGGDKSNPLTPSGVISGGGKLMVGSGTLGLGMRNTHTGGTEICNGADVRLRAKHGLGNCLTTITGQLTLTDLCSYALGTKVAGAGVFTHNSDSSKSIKFVDDGAILPSRTQMVNIVGNVDGSVKFDVAALVKNDRSKIPLYKIRTKDTHPGSLGDTNFVGQVMPKGWTFHRVQSGDKTEGWLYSAGLMLLAR